MSQRTLEFDIDTEVVYAYLDKLLRFIRDYYIRPSYATYPRFFKNVELKTIDSKEVLVFTELNAEEGWSVDAEMRADKPIHIRLASSETVPQTVLEQIRDDLVIQIQIFEEEVRKITIYFAWREGEKSIPEKLEPSRKELQQIFSDSQVWLNVIFLIGTFGAFIFLGPYAPLILVAAQFLLIFNSDKIFERMGDWKITSGNPKIHILEYPLPIEEYMDFRKRFKMEEVLNIKKEIYQNTLLAGKPLDCQTAGEVFTKYGIKYVPENMSTKIVDVYAIVKKVADKYGIPVPRIVISNVMLPNAAASGPSSSRGIVMITTGLLIQLEEDEIISILGHEFSHLKERDPIMLFILTSVEYLLRAYYLWSIPIFWYLMFYMPYLYLIAVFGFIALISKFFEARCDLESAIVIGKPQILAQALRKIGFPQLRYERIPEYRFQSWLSLEPHPPVHFRIQRLEAMKEPVKSEHPLLQSTADVIKGFTAALQGSFS